MKLASLLRETSYDRSGNYTHPFKLLDVLYDKGFEDFNATAHYYYEPEDYTDHPYGSTTAREHHSAVVELNELIADEDIKVYDSDGDKVVRVVTKGTDLVKDKDWDDAAHDAVANMLYEM